MFDQYFLKPLTDSDLVVWRIRKDTRFAEARIRDLPAGRELRLVLCGDGQDEQLLWSSVYDLTEASALGDASTGVLQEFQQRGWQLHALPS